MDRDGFWEVIEQGRRVAKRDGDEFAEGVRRHLEKLPIEEIGGFQLHLDRLMDQMYRWDLWGAAYVMNGGCSDDGFEYWRAWLIAQGRETWEAAIGDPETLAKAKLRYGEDGCYWCESLLYVASEAFESKGGTDLPRDHTPGPKDPAGQAWDENGDELERKFPKLWKKFFG